MMRKLNKQIGSLSLLLILMIVGCDSPSSSGTRAGDGRERLSINKSYAEFGDFVVHVNAMSSTDLTPEIAQTYEISRSNNTALINIVVLRKSGGAGQDVPVKAIVAVSAANLTGQLKSVALSEVESASSIYYIGQVAVDDQETINFDIDIRPEGEQRPLPVRFSHQFYTR